MLQITRSCLASCRADTLCRWRELLRWHHPATHTASSASRQLHTTQPCSVRRAGGSRPAPPDGGSAHSGGTAHSGGLSKHMTAEEKLRIWSTSVDHNLSRENDQGQYDNRRQNEMQDRMSSEYDDRKVENAYEKPRYRRNGERHLQNDMDYDGENVDTSYGKPRYRERDQQNDFEYDGGNGDTSYGKPQYRRNGERYPKKNRNDFEYENEKPYQRKGESYQQNQINVDRNNLVSEYRNDKPYGKTYFGRNGDGYQENNSSNLESDYKNDESYGKPVYKRNNETSQQNYSSKKYFNSENNINKANHQSEHQDLNQTREKSYKNAEERHIGHKNSMFPDKTSKGSRYASYRSSKSTSLPPETLQSIAKAKATLSSDLKISPNFKPNVVFYASKINETVSVEDEDQSNKNHVNFQSDYQETSQKSNQLNSIAPHSCTSIPDHLSENISNFENNSGYNYTSKQSATSSVQPMQQPSEVPNERSHLSDSSAVSPASTTVYTDSGSYSIDFSTSADSNNYSADSQKYSADANPYSSDSNAYSADPYYADNTLSHPYDRHIPRSSRELADHLTTPIVSPPNSRLVKVAVLGLPNCGKSTLVNSLVGNTVCSVSRKVHTTQCLARAVTTVGDTQMVFLDTPGVVTADQASRFDLSSSMVVGPEQSLSQADVLVVMVDGWTSYSKLGIHPRVLRLLALHPLLPAMLVINKMDKVKVKSNILDLTRLLTDGIVAGHVSQGRERLRRVSSNPERMAKKYLRAERDAENDQYNSEQGNSLDAMVQSVQYKSACNRTKQVCFDDFVNKSGPVILQSPEKPLMEEHSPTEIDEEDVFEGRLKMSEEQVTRFVSERKGWPKFQRVVLTSALTGDGVPALVDHLLECSKPAPWMFPTSLPTDQDPIQLVILTVREQFLDHLKHQLPYELKFSIDSWDVMDADALHIMVRVTCPRPQIVALLVGAKGRKINKFAKLAETKLGDMFKTDIRVRINVVCVEPEKKKNNDKEKFAKIK